MISQPGSSFMYPQLPSWSRQDSMLQHKTRKKDRERERERVREEVRKNVHFWFPFVGTFFSSPGYGGVPAHQLRVSLAQAGKVSMFSNNTHTHTQAHTHIAESHTLLLLHILRCANLITAHVNTEVYRKTWCRISTSSGSVLKYLQIRCIPEPVGLAGGTTVSK